ncbi:AraC family transcriptional regulator [Mycobacterium simiae]|nr:AraC family transcriptional regulator [Mycobacterium simiae]
MSAMEDPWLHDARIPPSVVVGVLEIAERRGVTTAPLMAGTGVARGQLELPETRLSFRQAATILRRALRALPQGPIGMHVGSRDVLLSWGVLGFAIRSCRSGRDAVTIGSQLHQAAGTLLDHGIEYRTDEFALQLRERCPDPELLAFLCEEAAAGILTLMRAVFGTKLTPTRIEFAYAPPPYADVYRQFFRCPLRFDASNTCLTFSSELLDRPISTSNPAQLTMAVQAARQLADSTDAPADTVAAVEGVLREYLPTAATMAQVAERLVMSERTLHRHLAAAGQKFGEIRDRVRQQRATALLRESNLSVAGIAARVGFSDSREFRRAYLRWTGRTPSADRSATPVQSAPRARATPGQ